MTTSTLPRTTAPSTADAPGERAPRTAPTTAFRRGPFAAATYREIGYALTSLPIAIGGFVLSVTLFSLGAGLSLTVLGLPVLAALLAAARGLGAAERRRAGALLGLDATAPADIPAATRPGWWAGVQARLTDAAGWKALLFQVVMFPWRVASFCLTLTFLITGWTVALYPLYAWVFPRYVGWSGYQVFDYTSDGVRHQYYLSSPLQIAAASLLGLVIVFLTPKLVHALTSVDRAAVRSLLGRNRPL
ncbi:sensor domain-containing protein [Streptomyces sp. NBC_00683]|uniref:sensor domain-containing protein n=1 Tax=Streptomyces sp. NBC_00683 TaxID=2903670 RepID=UPI002E309197|nr:sensor domain-containing protein [Streptomyces sp. NBC_00683]